MTGPQHYRKAEELLARHQHMTAGTLGANSVLAEAQVHATLALAAASSGVSVISDWVSVFGSNR